MCIDEQLLSAYLDGELSEPFKSQTEEHLSYCAACRARLESLRALDKEVASSTVTDQELDVHKDQVYQLLEKKYFSEDAKKPSVFRRKLELSVSSCLTVAAAIVLVFVGSFVFFGTSDKNTSEILPSFSPSADVENVRLVSASQTGLDSYSLEEILKYLDSRGYNVDISIKGLTPIEVPSEE